jgi:hypothetical protein
MQYFPPLVGLKIKHLASVCFPINFWSIQTSFDSSMFDFLSFEYFETTGVHDLHKNIPFNPDNPHDVIYGVFIYKMTKYMPRVFTVTFSCRDSGPTSSWAGRPIAPFPPVSIYRFWSISDLHTLFIETPLQRDHKGLVALTVNVIPET